MAAVKATAAHARPCKGDAYWHLAFGIAEPLQNVPGSELWMRYEG